MVEYWLTHGSRMIQDEQFKNECSVKLVNFFFKQLSLRSNIYPYDKVAKDLTMEKYAEQLYNLQGYYSLIINRDVEYKIKENLSLFTSYVGVDYMYNVLLIFSHQ